MICKSIGSATETTLLALHCICTSGGSAMLSTRVCYAFDMIPPEGPAARERCCTAAAVAPSCADGTTMRRQPTTVCCPPRRPLTVSGRGTRRRPRPSELNTAACRSARQRAAAAGTAAGRQIAAAAGTPAAAGHQTAAVAVRSSGCRCTRRHVAPSPGTAGCVRDSSIRQGWKPVGSWMQ